MSTTTSLLCQQCTVGTVRSFHQNVASNREWKPRKRMNWSPSSAMLRCQRKDHKWRSSVWRYQSHRSSLSIRCASSTTGTEEKEPTIEELLTEIEQGTDKATPRQRPLTRTTRTYSVQNEELVADKVLTGRVKSIMTFGAFIDLGARIDGLLHISKLGEGFIKSVEDVLTVGQEVQVQIMEVDLPNRRVKLKMYNPIPKAEPAKSPFGSAPGGGREAFRGKIAGRGPQVRRTETPKSNYQKGQAATGVVKNLTRRGCFVELPGGEEGFLHANEISAGGENSPIESLVQTGQEVKVKVLRIVDGRLNLTMKEEVDLKKLNEESNEQIFATNAFELAFRKNSIIRQYLEESGKLATVEPEGAKSKKKEAGVAKEETVEQTEEEKAPTAESEQSEKVEEGDEGKSSVVEKEEELGADKVPEAKVTEEKALEKEEEEAVVAEEEEVVEDKVPEAKKILEEEEGKAPSAKVKQEAEQSEKVQEDVEDKSQPVEKGEEVIEDKVPEAKVTEAEGVLEKEEENTAVPVVEKAPEAKATEAEEKVLEIEDKSPVVEKEEEVVEDKVPEAKVTEAEENVLEKEEQNTAIVEAEKVEQGVEQSEEAQDEVEDKSPVIEKLVEDKAPEAKVEKAPMAEAEKVESEAEKSENVEKGDEDDKSPVFVEDKLASAVKTFTETFSSTSSSGKKPSAVEEDNFEKEENVGTAEAAKVVQEEDKASALEENKGAAAEKKVDKTTDVPENLEKLSPAEELKSPEAIVEKGKAEGEENPVIAETQDSRAVPVTEEREEAIEDSKKVDEIQEEAPASQEPEAIKGSASTKEAEAGTSEKNKASAISAALVKQLREQSGAGMMDCKKALVETNGNFEKAIEYLRKKGLAGADKKASRIAAEGLVGSYIHDGRIGVLLEVNSETDFVSRGEIFTQLVEDLCMQVAASQQVEYVSVEDVPAEFRNKEFEIEMQREDLQSKPEAIRAKIVEGRITKRLGDLALLEQPFIKNDSVLVKDLVKQTIASVGEKVQVRRFTRYVLGEGLEKRTHDLAAEVAAQTKVPEKAQEQVATETPIESTDQPVKATTDEDESLVAISAALVKQLREETGTGMMDCKKALVETKGNFEQAKEYLRKKGLATAEKKVGRIAAEGLIVSYVHTGRIGVLMEVNCETDFVARNDVFKELAGDLAMQVVANPLVDYVSVDDVPAEVKEKEREIEMQREDLQNKPEQIRGKIVEGRLSKLLAERALLEQPFLKDDSILVKDMLKKTTATLGENIQVRRFVRYTLGEGIEKKSQNFVEEVAAQVKVV